MVHLSDQCYHCDVILSSVLPSSIISNNGSHTNFQTQGITSICYEYLLCLHTLRVDELRTLKNGTWWISFSTDLIVFEIWICWTEKSGKDFTLHIIGGFKTCFITNILVLSNLLISIGRSMKGICTYVNLRHVVNWTPEN